MSFLSISLLWYFLVVYGADFAAILQLTGAQRLFLLFSTLTAITFIEATRSKE